MMQEFEIKFGSLLCLDVRHQYYNNEKTGSLALGVSENTGKLIQKLGLAYKSYQNNSYIAYDYDKLNRLLLEIKETEQISLCFYLYNTEPYFSSITESPELSFSQVYYFTNSKPDSKLLHVNDFAGEKEIAELVQNNLSYDVKKAKTKLEIRNKWGDSVLLFENLEAGTHQLNLKSLNDGAYTLEENGKEVKSFVHITAETTKYKSGRMIGLVEILLDKKTKKTLLESLQSDQKKIHLDYQLSFAAKKSFWRYYLVLKSGLDFSGLQLDADSVKFEKSTKKHRVNGHEALIFQSSELLETKEIPAHKIRLKMKPKSGTDIVKLESLLPVASPEQLRIIKEDQKSIYCTEIYYYL